jgi:hypothetical protein
MPDLSEDELTVLLIAAEGEPMIPIGRWEGPTKSLLARGYLKAHGHAGDPTGHFNNRITPAGKKAAEEAENANLRAVIGVNNELVHQKETMRQMAEQIVVQLVDLAEASMKVTGDNRDRALRNWSKVILAKAMETGR